MESFVTAFIRASLIWLGVGVLIGVSMAFWPGEALVYRPAHVHANLLGFVSMMIFGVAYHVLPRFSGNPLHWRGLARVHFWVANGGLALLVGGWIVRAWWFEPGGALIRIGAAVSAVGAFMFIYNLWQTLGRRPALRVRPAASHAAPGSAPAAKR